ncbi:MAG: peptidylprolyl isomerase [Sandaracinaceae bacterium]
MSDSSVGQKIQTIFLVLIIGVLSVIMAVVGFSNPSRRGDTSFTDGPSYAAEVYGDSISEGDFRAAYTLLQFNRYPAEQARTLRLREYTLDGLIERELLVREANRIGFTASGEDVLRHAAEDEVVLLGGPVDAPDGYPQGEIHQPFREREGNFSSDYFRRFIQRQLHRSIEEFVTWQVNETLANKVREMVTASVSVSPREVWDAYVQENDRAQLSYVRFDPAYYRERVEVTDQAVSDWMGENAEAVDEEYRRQRHRYTNLEEQTRARHILIEVPADAPAETRDAARQRAEGLLRRAQAGDDFAALARENSDDEGSAARGGDLGWFPRGRMVAPFEEAAFSQEVDTIRDTLVESPFGFHILKVEGRRQGDVPEDEAKREIADGLFRAARARELAREDADRALAYLRDGHTPQELDARLAHGWDAEEPATEEPATEEPATEEPAEDGEDATEEEEEVLPQRAPNAPQVRETLNFGRAERAISGPFNSDPLTQAAFDLTMDSPLPDEPMSLGDSWFVYQLIGRTEATEEGFDEDNQERIRSRLLVDKRHEVLSAYIGALRSRAESEGAVRINQRVLSYGIETPEGEDGEEPTSAGDDEEGEG